MMYRFYDTTEIPEASPRPSEALRFNGVWIDDAVTPFRTLYVSGRESFTAEIAEETLESVDGSLFLRRRLEPRTIIVGYQMTAATPQEYMTAFNRLGSLMSGIQAQVVFADEPDKYYVGTCRSIGSPEPGRLAVKSEIEIYCPDPCKYSIQQKTVSVSNGIFSVNYTGSYPVRPVFTASFSGAAKRVIFTGENAIVTAGSDSSNVFASGDILEIDCSTAEIVLNSASKPELGAVGNEFEAMLLNPGVNVITPSCTGAAPAFTMKYREAWL
ncbi:MAG: phage tail family protein [Sarcina sp.]|nr:phage tail family protein [Sarcina sp.]